mmetsp:Transcript_10447/g.20870  ORF Transcript_10447/g.20870 Transcript_10447/m.20870 type:complete len:209 (-) Transcript_10447:167-793(-)
MASVSSVIVDKSRALVVDPFCLRQFTTGGSDVGGAIGISVEEFEMQVNLLFENGSAPLVDGYAPFCKHVFVPNFAGVRRTTIAITDENSGMLRSGYEARTPKELPVLNRWFPKELVGDAGEAAFLDVILYSREQIRKENAAMSEDSWSDAPWGIVSIKPQDVDHELPMQPITVMRNALGAEHGGSGVPLDAAAYRASAEFWEKNAPVK